MNALLNYLSLAIVVGVVALGRIVPLEAKDRSRSQPTMTAQALPGVVIAQGAQEVIVQSSTCKIDYPAVRVVFAMRATGVVTADHQPVVCTKYSSLTPWCVEKACIEAELREGATSPNLLRIAKGQERTLPPGEWTCWGVIPPQGDFPYLRSAQRAGTSADVITYTPQGNLAVKALASFEATCQNGDLQAALTEMLKSWGRDPYQWAP